MLGLAQHHPRWCWGANLPPPRHFNASSAFGSNISIGPMTLGQRCCSSVPAPAKNSAGARADLGRREGGTGWWWAVWLAGWGWGGARGGARTRSVDRIQDSMPRATWPRFRSWSYTVGTEQRRPMGMLKPPLEQGCKRALAPRRLPNIPKLHGIWPS